MDIFSRKVGKKGREEGKIRNGEVELGDTYM